MTPVKNNFDFLRFAFATVVLFGHSYTLLGIYHDPLTWALNSQIFCGTVAVYGFFVISGFLITQSWQRSKNNLDYFRKRVLRIYPGFLMAALLCAIAFSPLGAESPHQYFSSLFRLHQLIRTVKSALLLKVLDLPGSFVHQVYPEVNGSIWTIQYEFMCYVIVAVLGSAGLLKRRWLIAGLSLSSLCFFWIDSLHPFPWLQRFEFPHALLMPLRNLPQFLVYFLSGMLAALFYEHIKFPLWAIILSCLILVCSLFVGHGLLFSLPFVGPYLLLAFAYSPSIRLTDWGKHGDLSYGLYLYAWPIQQIIIHDIPVARHPLIIVLLAFAITYGFAKLSWQYIEKPFLKRKSHNASQAAVSLQPVS